MPSPLTDPTASTLRYRCWRCGRRYGALTTLLVAALVYFGERYTQFSLFRFREADAVQQARSGNTNNTNITLSSSNVSIPFIPKVHIPSIPIGVDVRGKTVMKPLLGVGTWKYNNVQAYESVCKAFLAGYTMIDVAWAYKNQKGVGKAIRDCWKGTREELFVMAKIAGGLSREEVRIYHDKNLADLQLNYVDHLMTHSPGGPRHAPPDHASPARRKEEWKALQEIYQAGQARSIGISHYCPRHIDDVLEVSHVVKPSINQVEYHVGFSHDRDELLAKCRQHNITMMSFSPLCGPCFRYYQPGEDGSYPESLTTGTLVQEIASHYNHDNATATTTGAEVALRFIVQQALAENNTMGGMGGVIPRSNSLEHLLSNRRIFDFELTGQDMELLFKTTEPRDQPRVQDCDVP